MSARVSNSNGEWTSEFAKVVGDMITIENTASIANKPSLGGFNGGFNFGANTGPRGSLEPSLTFNHGIFSGDKREAQQRLSS
jgi:hypothetical protein